MKIHVHAWAVTALAVSLLAVTGAAASADSTSTEKASPVLNGPHVLKEKKVRLSGSGDNVVRSGPGNSFAIVGVFPKGEEFVVIAKRDDWYNIRLSDTNTGWVHASLCKEFDDMSDLEFRPNPKLFSRVGSFALTGYGGGYAFDRKSNSLVLGGRLAYHVFEFLTVEGNVGWTHVVRPAEIVERLFNLALEEEDFHLLYYAFNANVLVLPGRQMVPFLTFGTGSAIMQGQTETAMNYGAGINFFVKQSLAFRFEFRTYTFNTESVGGRDNTNFEFTVGNTYYF